jgi:Dolichyl-phosphate-mannose-protein mannosyltransferase
VTTVIPPGNTQEGRAADVAPADGTTPDGTAADGTTPDDTAADDTPSGPRADRWRVPPHRRFAAAVLAAMLVGLALRVAIGLTDEAPATDETAYLRSGISLVEGDGFAREGRAETHFPPFVPLLLGLGSRVFDDPHTGTVVLTFVASTALILPLALLGRRVAGARAGIATAWLAALAPGVSTSVANRGAGSEGVYLLVVVGALWCVVSAADHRGAARVARVAAGGLLVGLAYLTRPEGLFMGVPLGLAVLALGLRGAGDRRRRLLRTAGLAGAFAVPIVACIVPYAAYLHRHTGSWELSAKTQDASIEAWHAVARADRQERDSVLYALDETGLSFSAERTSLVQLARDDPGGYFAIVRTNVSELGEVIANPVEGQMLTWLLLPLPVWALAVWGAWRFRRVLTMRIILALAALPVATALAFFVQPRYVMLTTALAIVPAGAALATLPGRWRAPAAGLAAVLLVVSSVQAFEGPGGWWHPSDHTDQRAAGEWLAANTADDARIMSRSMVVEHYADRPTMAIPYADLDEIVEYGRHYGAQYIVADWYTVRRLRPQLLPLREGADVAGLRLVHEVRREGRTTSIYAFEPVPVVPAEIGSPLGFVGDG